MAKKKETEVVADDLSGTVEGLRRERFEREKAYYEQRTGEKCNYVMPAPVTRTPLAKSVEVVESVESIEWVESVESVEEGEAQGDE